MRAPLRSLVAVLVLSLGAGACATVSRLDAGGDVQALLVAIRDNDRAGFDAHIDKPALKRQVESRIVDATRASGASDAAKGLGYLLSRAAADLAGEALLRPDVFRAVAEHYGYTPGQPVPDRLAIAAVLQPTSGGRVCVARQKGGPCVLIFARQDANWRLTEFVGDPRELRLP